MDVITIVSIVSAIAAVVGLIVSNFWNSLQRKDKIMGDREALEYSIEKTARAKFLQEEETARQLAKENEEAMVRFKEEIRDYVDKGDLDVKRELSYAIKLVCKDISFLKDAVFNSRKSKPGQLFELTDEEWDKMGKKDK